MKKQYMTHEELKEKAQEFVQNEMEGIQTVILYATLKEDGIDDWHNVTEITKGDYVYFYSVPEELTDGTENTYTDNYGIVVDICGNDIEVRLGDMPYADGLSVTVPRDELELEDPNQDGFFPAWGRMWSFKDSYRWLSNEDDIRIMSECGFEVYEHDEWGYFFGINGGGYDFYEYHWIPLYKARFNVEEVEEDPHHA